MARSRDYFSSFAVVRLLLDLRQVRGVVATRSSGGIDNIFDEIVASS